MNWILNDGGRGEAGFKGTTGDCVTRAIAIATGRPYQEVYDALNEISAKHERQKRRGKSNSRTGVFKTAQHRYMASIGWKWTPTMSIGSGCKVHLRSEELPAGRIVASVSRHAVAVIDGVAHDIYDCTRGGKRCVYGYWQAA